ncbi:phage tail tape measure protein [Mycolicibacterium mengxianglii]|uniref:phage tail tape measure protein n=1 Tax=Mycolicibacterium mengxianglii TaxID=2736649 RepID=UPI001E39429C|nr:phage tail tape measure protein [Mycolicibacterium mengxianglii]
MPEIASAWVTLAVSTRGMQGDIRRAMQQAERGTKLNPKVDTAKLSSQGSKAGKEFGDRFTSGAKTAMATLAAATVGAGVISSFKQVMSVGMDWTNNMNTLSAVTGATADQLKAAGDAARALGNDITIPATSANDAASAMTELAKGGFTVQQSMDAAQGSLRLAAAAQISATEAATIQSQALQAFGLDAAGATKMSDTLANAANASSAEIVDVAAAMQQAGTVANQFGLSAEDTAAAIGLLANNGIKGSDAGTLLKSSLLALTDQGKPARESIRELGLTIYDAEGKFVGLHNLFGQLGEASRNMTPEMYQAATATLFGSDAMRLAGVAAKDGSASYDQMRTAIDRQGAAADVAAAKTQGLPGAWERVKNSLESLQLKAYDALEGPVTQLLGGMTSGLDDLEGKAAGAWQQLTVNPVIRSTWSDTVTAFTMLAGAAQEVWPPLVRVGQSLALASGALGVSTWKLFVVALETAAGVLDLAVPLLETVADLMGDHQGLVTAAAGAWLLFKTVPALMGRVSGAVTPAASALSTMTQRMETARGGVSTFGSAYRTHMEYLRQANPSINTARAHLQTLGSVAGSAASGGMTAMRGATGGLLTALGGPWGLAITGATVAIGALAQAHAQAAQDAANLRQREIELQNTLDEDTGKLTEETRKKVAERFDDKAAYKGNSIFQRGEGFGIAGQTLVDASTGNTEAYQQIRSQGDSQVLGAIDANRRTSGMAGELEKMGVSRQELTNALAKEGANWDIVNQKIATYNDRQRALGDDTPPVISSLDSLVKALPDTAESWTVLTQAVNEERRELTSATAALNRKNEAVHGSWTFTEEAAKRFKDLGASILSVPNDKTIIVDALTEKSQADVERFGYTVTHLEDGTVKVVASTTESENRIKDLIRPRTLTVTIAEKYGDTSRPEVQNQIRNDFRAAFGQNANGAIVPMADGGLRQISKPSIADIYAGRGAGTVFAEQETGGEAYIPLAVSKRRRSMRILAEVARLFGMNVMEDGGITVDSLKEMASQLSGGSYVRGGPPGPSGTDCSGAQAWIANLLTGGSGRFSTADEASALLSRGFQQGDPPAGVSAYWVGWKNGGPGGGHTAGTIVDPYGGNVNVEMGGRSGGGAFGGSAAGASEFPNRAWIQIAGGEDPNAASTFSGGSSAAVQSASARVTSAKASVTSAQASLDQADAAVAEAQAKGQSADKIADLEKKRDAAQQRLDAATERQTAAETRLSEVKDKAAADTDKAASSSGMDGKSLGQTFLSGIFETLGVPNFMNLFETPNAKSLTALANYGLGFLGNTGEEGSGTGGGSIGGLNLPGISDLLKPIGGQALEPKSLPDAPHQGTGALPGPQFVVNGNVGMDPRALTQRFDAKHNESYRRNMGAVRPQ